jgi:hypothetical protein
LTETLASGQIDRARRPAPGAPAGRRHNVFRGEAMSFLRELWAFMRVRKKFWLLPVIVMMTLFGGLLVLSKGTAVAPFIYTLF